MTRFRLTRWLLFRIERWIQRGWLYQLAITAALIVLISVGGGFAAWAATDAFEGPARAVWWAFLRLTDPGYLGDDEGAVLRTISTVVTVAGYVLFMGSLVAIMTQWLHRRMALLERGLTPMTAQGHIVILGWTDRTLDLVRELVISRGRAQRFLKRRGLRSLQLAILAEEVTSARRQELAEHVGQAWDVDDIVLRSGSLLDADDLARVDAAHAASLIVPATRAGNYDRLASDTRVVKALMTMNDASLARRSDIPQPTVVAEFMESDSQTVAESLAGHALEAVESDRMIARLLAQTTRHPGLAVLYRELVSNDHGPSLYVQISNRLDGCSFREARAWFPTATLIGVVRMQSGTAHSHLNPPPSFTLAPDDRLVLIASSYDESTPVPSSDTLADAPVPSAPLPAKAPASASEQHILCCGWSPRIAALLHEYSSYTGTRFRITLLSVTPIAQRRAQLAEVELPEHVHLQHHEGDYTRASVLEAVDLASYDTVLFLGSDRFASGEEADARTLMGRLVAHAHTKSDVNPPAFVVELMDADNAPLLRSYPGDVIVPPALMSRMLAQITLRRDLGAVFGELFGPGGADITFRPATHYAAAETTCSTRHLRAMVAVHRETLLGIRQGRASERTLHLNPDADASWTVDKHLELAVLAGAAT